MKSTPNLFRSKHLAALVVVASILLATYYFSHNLSKLRNTLKFFYQQEFADALRRSGKTTVSVVDVKKKGRSLIKRYFYSPFCTAYGYSVYALPCDLRDRTSLPAVTVEIDGRPGGFNKLFIFNDFSLTLDHSTRKAFVFIHSDYLPTLRKLFSNRDLVIGHLLSRSSSAGEVIFTSTEEIRVSYAGQQDGEWVERMFHLPRLGPRPYELRFEYRVALGAQPYFITGQHPDWFVHQKLPVSLESARYSAYRIVATPSRELDHPVLILRNWGGIGTVFFKNIQIRLMEPNVGLYQAGHFDNLGELGGPPDVRPLGSL